MKLEIIDLHTVAVDLLSENGWTLDGGARGFKFSEEMSYKGQNVVAVDPGPDVHDPILPFINFEKKALVGYSQTGIGTLKRVSDPQASWVEVDHSTKLAGKDVAIVNCITIAELSEKYKVGMWDCIKLNVEGAEYDILERLNEPIAKQIVCSFHEHTGRGLGIEGCDKILKRLERWYDVHQKIWESRYSAGKNYWDVLLVLKGIG